jgi:hypothetical protein
MSDSLLNLLEVLNEVLEEQKLQEQASGGAPTEDELWDIVSNGLANYLKTKLPPENGETNQDKKAIEAKLTNPEERFYYAFGLLEWRLRNEEQKPTQTVENVAKWLVGLNNYYLKQPKDSGQVLGNQNEQIFNAIRAGKTLSPFEVPAGRGVRYYYTLNKLLFGFITKFLVFDKYGLNFKKVGERYSEQQLKDFLENLQNGLGIISGGAAFGTAQQRHTDPSVIAQSKYFLDDKDYKVGYENILNGDYNTLNTFVNSISSNNLPAPLKKRHADRTISMITKAFEVLIDDERNGIPIVKWGIQKIKQKDKDTYTSVSPEIEKIIEDFVENFMKKTYSYQDRLKSAGSGKTFTEPRIASLKTNNYKDFDTVVENFFGDKKNSSFEDKIDILIEKMSIFESTNLKQEIEKLSTVKEFVNRVLLMEYFIEMSKGFEAKTAGTLFEYFLAKVFGGKVVGARGDAVDFLINDGKEKTLGSAKLISVTSGADPESRIFKVQQAVSGFLEHTGQTIVYLIGAKRPSSDKILTNAVAPLEIERVDIFKLEVLYEGNEKEIKVNGKNRKNIWKTKKKDDEETNSEKDSKGIFDLGKVIVKDKLKPIGTLQIMTTTEEGIKGFRQRAQAAVTGDTKKILDLVAELFKNLRLADEKSRIYTSSGDVSDGTDALNALTDSQTNLRQIGDYAFTDKKDEYDKLPEPNDT